VDTNILFDIFLLCLWSAMSFLGGYVKASWDKEKEFDKERKGMYTTFREHIDRVKDNNSNWWKGEENEKV